ncbi:MAG: carbohydrate ABC transporter permease [Halanaerobiales bacterium]
MRKKSWKNSDSFEQFKFLLPALIPVIFLSLLPLVRGITLGFTDYQFGGEISFNGIQNYLRMLGDYNFWQSFKTGFIWSIGTTGGQLILGLGLALILNKQFALRGWARVLVLVPWAMPPVIRGIMWRFMYHPQMGGINHLLINLGIIDAPINWLSSFDFALGAVIIVGIWGGLPQVGITLLAGLQSITPQLYEAAKIDGAGDFQQFLYITLPQLAPIAIAITILRLIWNFNSFGLVHVLTRGGPGGNTRIPMLFAYEEGFKYGDLGYAAALGNVMVIIVSVLMVSYLYIKLKEEF